tara:strand:- start:1581 stop:1856 length:276 start_codon:yes stop_codon:yes gene_type:complete
LRLSIEAIDDWGATAETSTPISTSRKIAFHGSIKPSFGSKPMAYQAKFGLLAPRIRYPSISLLIILFMVVWISISVRIPNPEFTAALCVQA